MPPETTIAYIGIGSNLGDRSGYIDQALSLLDDVTGIEVVALSSMIETSPKGGPSGQPSFPQVSR